MSVAHRRADLLLVEQGLAPTRNRAQALILAAEWPMPGQKQGMGQKRPSRQDSRQMRLELVHILDDALQSLRHLIAHLDRVVVALVQSRLGFEHAHDFSRVPGGG